MAEGSVENASLAEADDHQDRFVTAGAAIGSVGIGGLPGSPACASPL